MGSFAGFLGSAAEGFEQARQTDLQRQFANEQNRRNQFGQLLQRLASDENVHPYTRQQALKEYLNMSQMPHNKAYKPNFEGLVAPAEEQMQVPPTTGTAQGRPLPAPPLEAGFGSETVQTQSQMLPGQRAKLSVEAPPNQPGIFMSPEQMRAREAKDVEAKTGAQLRGQIAARKEALEGIPLPPGQEAALALGMPGGISAYGAQGRGDTIPDEQSPTGWTRIIRDHWGNEMQRVAAQPPSAYAPTETTGYRQVEQRDGSIVLVPVTSVSQKQVPGQKPAAASEKPQAKVGKERVPVGGKAPTPTIMIAPPTQPGGEPRVISAKPGGTVPAGSVTAGGYSTSQIPTAPVRTRAQMSAAQLEGFSKLEQEINRQKDNLGPMVGRWNAFLQGKVGSGDPDFAYLKGKVDLVQTAMMMIHAGGRPAFGLLKKFEDQLNAGKMDAPTLLGGLRAIKEQMQTYAKEGVLWGSPVGGYHEALPVGTVEDGYRFKGGDPAKQTSWEKVGAQ